MQVKVERVSDTAAEFALCNHCIKLIATIRPILFDNRLSESVAASSILSILHRLGLVAKPDMYMNLHCFICTH